MLYADYIKESMSEEMKQMVFGESLISEATGKKPETTTVSDGSEEFVINEKEDEEPVPQEEPMAEEVLTEGWFQTIKDKLLDAGYGSRSIGLGAYANPDKKIKKAAEEYIRKAYAELEPKLKKIVAMYPEFKVTVGVDEYSLKKFLSQDSASVFFVKWDLGSGRDFTTEQFKKVDRLLNATMMTSSYGTRYMSSKYDNDFGVLFVPRPSKFYDYIEMKISIRKPQKESFNSVAESFFSGMTDDDRLRYKMESVLTSEEDIFYNRNKFRDGETNLCFIVGLAGSGKSSMASTMARGSHNVEHYRLDNIVENKSKGRGSEYYEKMGDMAYAFFNGPGKRYYVNDSEIESKLNLTKDKYLDKITNAFVDFAVSYARSHDNTKFIIEGVQLHRYIDPSRFRDFAVCIKGTSIAKSMYQTSKRDGSLVEPLKHSFQYAGDDLKLRKWKQMYKNLADTDDRDGFEDDEDFEERSMIPVENDDLLYMEAFHRYTQSSIEHEAELIQFLTSTQAIMEATGVIHEADSLQTKVKNRFDIAVNFIARISDRFIKAMEGILLSQKSYLEKYQNVILQTKWSDTMEYSYKGDYKEAISRCMNFDMPQFNYEVYAPFLREDGYDKLITRFTAGHNFKYDPSNENLAEQFKNYFLAFDRGESKGKFSQLEPKAIYEFCHDQYNNLVAKIKKDEEILKRSETAFLQQARNAEREASQNKQGEEQITTNPNTQTAGKGGTTPIQTTGQSQPITPVQASARIDMNFRPTEHPEFWQETANAAATTNNASSGSSSNANLQITNTEKTQVNQQTGQMQNKTEKSTTTTDDQDLTNMMTKWIKLCQAFTTGKYTAIQKISKDYMDIIRAHVKAHTSKDAKVDSTNPNNKQQKAEETPPTEQKK